MLPSCKKELSDAVNTETLTALLYSLLNVFYYLFLLSFFFHYHVLPDLCLKCRAEDSKAKIVLGISRFEFKILLTNFCPA